MKLIWILTFLLLSGLSQIIHEITLPCIASKISLGQIPSIIDNTAYGANTLNSLRFTSLGASSIYGVTAPNTTRLNMQIPYAPPKIIPIVDSIATLLLVSITPLNVTISPIKLLVPGTAMFDIVSIKNNKLNTGIVVATPEQYLIVLV